MGNILCCDKELVFNPQVKQTPKSKSPEQKNYVLTTYFTNPEIRDEDFTFNDKIKMQSIKNKYELNYLPCFQDIYIDNSWQRIAEQLVVDINHINTDPDWANEKKNGLQIIYSQNDEKIFFGSNQVPANHLNQAIININGSSQSGSRQDSSTRFNDSLSQGNSQSLNDQNSLVEPQIATDISIGQTLNNPRKSTSQKQMCVNTIKLEFEVNCSAEKMLKGLQNLKQYTNKIQKQKIIESSQNQQFTISHIVLSKSMQKVQRDLLVANYYTDIGPNLNNCYASVNHHKVPELPDVVRAQIIKGGHTFFEQYQTDDLNLTSSKYRDSNNNGLRKESSNLSDGQRNSKALGSMNLNIGSVKTKVRFYGEFYCKSSFDEDVVRMIFLTEFREYITTCKKISQINSVTSSECDLDSVSKNSENIVDIDLSIAS